VNAPVYFDSLAPGRLRQCVGEARAWAERLRAHREPSESYLDDMLTSVAEELERAAHDGEVQLQAFDGLSLDLDAARSEAARLAAEYAERASAIESLKDSRSPEPTAKSIIAARDAAYIASIHAARAADALERVERARATRLHEGELLRLTKGLEKGRTRARAMAMRPGERWEPSGDPLALAGFTVSRSEARELALEAALATWHEGDRDRVRAVLTKPMQPTLSEREMMTGIDAQWQTIQLAARKLDADVRACFAAHARTKGEAEIRRLIERLDATPSPTMEVTL
jgi:hypothetical protein